jgi:hypothetical protein
MVTVTSKVNQTDKLLPVALRLYGHHYPKSEPDRQTAAFKTEVVMITVTRTVN